MNYLKHKLIIIGASTGGPGHIEQILSSLQKDFSASVVIAQHMGEEYLPSFARALDERCTLRVSLIQNGMEILKNRVYVCSGSCRFVLQNGVVKIEKTESVKNGFNPDIDMLINSAVNLKDELSLMGIILTGIGSDGSKGCSELLDVGVRCLGESHKSAVVFGMPKNAKEMNDKVELMDLKRIINEIVEFGR